MMALQLSDAARILDARSISGDVLFRGVSTDSRKLQQGNLFVALQGPNFDGHDYVERARAQGAAAAAVSRLQQTALPLLEVGDTRLALGQLAAHWRARFSLPVVAITGSNGKTTVRTMTTSILSCAGQTLSTQGNLNNDIGLPLTLFRLSRDDAYAVLEMGASHPGEIDYLAGIARPTIALVTNAGPAHLEGFGDLEGVARSKGEVFARLGDTGIAVINADDRYAPLWRELAGQRQMVDFGLAESAAVHADWEGSISGSQVTLFTPRGETEFHLPLPGRHNVMNALAASAAALAAGVGLDAVRKGLESLSPVAGRFNIHQLPEGVTIIDDTYNANPESLQVALEVLAMAGGETWLVLGDMGELGSGAETLHREAGHAARRLGIDRLFALGPLAQEAAQTFGDRAASFDTLGTLATAVRQELHAGVHILVKGSRSMQMERIVEALGVTAAYKSNPPGAPY
ncbi:MAG: UDP-N-acetylmuramoyl-tripeptide--D-alanyl-D-alanine ligase [Pseudomonadota bacterium]|nr:UDP-N-acetylmuramoyl-tripeptide--D-alanyl-D-alanine ligase [Pseudomonadota bacterium]